jgi:lipoprotein-releasing system ATP-binding protein
MTEPVASEAAPASEPSGAVGAPIDPKPAGEPILRVRGLVKNYPRQRVDARFWDKVINKAWGWTGKLDEWARLNEGLPVLRGVDLDVHEGEILAIVGPSGAGKSTLLHLIGALDPPSKGLVQYRGEAVTAMDERRLAAWRNVTVGYVFQFYHLFPDLTALENVLLPAMVSLSVGEYRAARGALHARARELLDRVGLGDRSHHHPSQLSGGEQQRVAIARALLLQPKLLLCDEPTGNLDRKTGETILELLWELKAKSGQTYVIVTHDERLAERADRVIKMEDGQIIQELRRDRPKPAGVAVDPPLPWKPELPTAEAWAAMLRTERLGRRLQLAGLVLLAAGLLATWVGWRLGGAPQLRELVQRVLLASATLLAAVGTGIRWRA